VKELSIAACTFNSVDCITAKLSGTGNTGSSWPKNLISLDMGTIKISNRRLTSLSSLTSLTDLNLSKCGICDIGCMYIRSISTLLKLNLSYCGKVSGVGITLLHVLPLQVLHLRGDCKSISDRVHAIARELPCLQKLDLSHCNTLEDIHIVPILTNLHKLHTLIVRNCPYCFSNGNTNSSVNMNVTIVMETAVIEDVFTEKNFTRLM
jgi:Leucine-rich repeat (LRR) protein